MKLLVGYTADGRGAEAIELAAALAAGTADASLQIAIVLPAAAPFNAVYPGGDHGFDTILSAQVDRWAAEALALVPEGLHAAVVARPAPAIAEGLIALGEECGAEALVLGGRKRHMGGFFLPGHIANALLHASPLPVFMSSPTALRSLRHAEGQITRLTMFIGDRPGAREAIATAARLAAARGVGLRVATLVEFGEASSSGRSVDALVQETRGYLDEQVAALGVAAEVQVVAGDDLDQAVAQLSWQPGDLALFGSARLAVHPRMFLGSKAQRILGSLSVPLGVIPAGTSR